MGDNRQTCTTGCLLACIFLSFDPVFASSQDTTMSGGSIAGIVVSIVALLTAGGGVVLCKKCQLFCFHRTTGGMDSETQTNNGAVHQGYQSRAHQNHCVAQPQNESAVQVYNGGLNNGVFDNMAIIPPHNCVIFRQIEEMKQGEIVKNIKEVEFLQRQ